MHPKYHLTAPKHWINDPIGFIYYQNNYHLFYQHFPYENKWGTMHWGHATSKDLVNWVDQELHYTLVKTLMQMVVFLVQH